MSPPGHCSGVSVTNKLKGFHFVVEFIYLSYMKTIAKFIYSTIQSIYDILLTYIALVCISFHLYFQIKWILQQNKLTFNSLQHRKSIFIIAPPSFPTSFFSFYALLFFIIKQIFIDLLLLPATLYFLQPRRQVVLLVRGGLLTIFLNIRMLWSPAHICIPS